jgi:uncharacterized protein YjbI with pentapeptide repeats
MSNVFAGKYAFAAVGLAKTTYLGVLARRAGANGPTQYFPAMNGLGQAGGFACILYAVPDGTVRVQMPNLMWVAHDAVLGNLYLTTDPAQACAVILSGAPAGHLWQVRSDSFPLTVGYYPDTDPPVLTTNETDGFQAQFTPTVITPSAADIVKAGACRGGDLANVVLDGASLAGADLTNANFSQASLVRSNLAGCTLTTAVFTAATLAGVGLTGATLDRADMTGAILGPPSWGAPVSATGLILTQCKAVGAVLGGQASPLDCTQATLSGGDFSGANLRGLILRKAAAGGAILAGTDLTGAILDGADLSNVFAAGAILRQASLKNLRGPNAVFVGADLSNADLSQAALGAKTYLFQIASSFADGLGENAYPSTALIGAFAQSGVTLSPEAPIAILVPKARWEIGDPHGPYLLIQVAAGIDVFLAAPDLAPAVFRGAVCLATKAPGAGLAGADLRQVAWYGGGATLDHADLENACLAGSLLASTDFTQAFLSGADFSGAVLAQAIFSGCSIGTGSGNQPFSLEGAQIQGCTFTHANLRGALLVDAGVSLAQGVPLFVLPGSDEQYLTPHGIATLAPAFTKAGYALGTNPTVSLIQTWAIDNSSDPITSDPRSYLVRSSGKMLRVFDGASNAYYFELPSSYAKYLNAPHPAAALINAFAGAGYGLVATATTTTGQYWSIQAGGDAILAGPFGYRIFTASMTGDTLTVFGSTILLMRDWPQYPGGLAFAATTDLEGALNPACLGPSGAPAAWVAAGRQSWTAFLTARSGSVRMAAPQPPAFGDYIDGLSDGSGADGRCADGGASDTG